MPTQLYDKEQILDTCLAVFASFGYEKTSTVMLAEAAGISRALIFHHFKSKKDLYLAVLDRCFEKAKIIIGMESVPEGWDFFEAKEKLSIMKFNYYKENPDEYKVLGEAFSSTPDELKGDIEERFGQVIPHRDRVWEQLFERVNLKEGVDRRQAYELVKVALNHWENKVLSQVTDEKILDEEYFQSCLKERNNLLSMIRYGIQK